MDKCIPRVMGLGNGLGGEVFAVQVWEPEFESSAPT